MHTRWSKGIRSKLLAAGALAGALALPLPLLAQGSPAPGSHPSGPSSSIQVANDNDQEVQEGTESKDAEEHEGRAAHERAGRQERGESAEAAALAAQARITQQQAESAVLAANPGAVIVHAGLENENGSLVYGVQLRSGQDVKVDAGTGSILHTDQGDIGQKAQR